MQPACACATSDAAELLAHLEKVNRREGDLGCLREIRAYKAKHNL